MSDTTISKLKSKDQPVDDYDDRAEDSYTPTAPVQLRPSKAQSRYEDDEYNEAYLSYGRSYLDEDREEDTVLSLSRGRALILTLSVLMLLVVFGVAVWLFLSRSEGTPSTGPVAGVPVITGFDANTQKEDQKPVVGSYAPDFTWQESGQTVSLSSFRGKKPVFVNFWGTWCPPCRGEMPEMETAYTKHFGKLEVIGVSMAPKDTASMVLNFVNQYKYNWKFIHDGDFRVGDRYQVANVPSSYFIGTDGIIKAVQVGAMNGTIMENYINQVITP